MEPIKKKSAAFHRMRRAYFEKKNADGALIQNENEALEEPEKRKGRKPLPIKKYPRQTQDEWVAAERKRIFFLEIRRRTRRNNTDG